MLVCSPQAGVPYTIHAADFMPARFFWRSVQAKRRVARALLSSGYQTRGNQAAKARPRDSGAIELSKPPDNPRAGINDVSGGNVRFRGPGKNAQDYSCAETVHWNVV
jgi:hypothetical protein